MPHVVTHPQPPFLSRSGALRVHQVPEWQDNLVWVVECVATGECAVVDGPTADGALALIAAKGLTLTTVLNTHTHPDHVGINRDLEKRGLLGGLHVFGPARDASRVPGLTRAVDEGDEVAISASTGRVLLTEGHIDGHVSYLFEDLLFCGDTMFGAGCGYLFDGPPAKMHASLQRLAELDPLTKVCCAHEYTEDNLRFAWTVEPDNEALRERIQRVFSLRARGECSVPSTMEEERATNPFLRHKSETLRRSVSVPSGSPPEVFAATRALKDSKAYKERGDEELPI